MTLNTHIQLWKREAIAHGYAGFIVTKTPDGYDRVFMHSENEINYSAKNAILYCILGDNDDL